jgi:hypothetical protein
MRITIRKYSKSTKSVQEIIENRLRIGFAECPKCRNVFGIYQDEIDSKGFSRGIIRHSCGFASPIILENWEEKREDNRFT